MQRIQRVLERAFTLIELLVVIAIIAILVAILLPVLSRVKQQGWMADCTSQLNQFGKAIAIYQSNFEDYTPPWLSVLYPQYIKAEQLFTCPADESDGTAGVIPTYVTQGENKFLETWDAEGNTCETPPGVQGMRNTDIKRCSYLYEFCWAECSWWTGGIFPDQGQYNGNGDGYVSWLEAKYTERKGLAEDAGGNIVTYDDEAYGGHVPILRCFWHTNENDFRDADQPDFGKASTVLNLGCGSFNVYRSDATGDGWKEEAKRRH